MATNLWGSRRVDVPFRNGLLRSSPSGARRSLTWDCMHDQVDAAYICFSKLRRSDADESELAADAARACWRLKRVVGVCTGATRASGTMPLRVRAAWLALNVSWGARPRHDIATAQLVVATMRSLLVSLEGCRARLTDSSQLDAVSRRRAELAVVLERAEMVEAGLLHARTPLWESFIPRPGSP